MSNRREQKPKAQKSKHTDPYRAEKRIKGAGVPRNPKHRNRGYGDF